MKKKFCIIFFILSLLFVLCGCEEKILDKGSDPEIILSAVSDRLKKMEEDCEFAKRQDADYMADELGIYQDRCHEMRKIIDDFLTFGTADIEGL